MNQLDYSPILSQGLCKSKLRAASKQAFRGGIVYFIVSDILVSIKK